MIRLHCPECNAKLKAPDDLAGKKGRCPECMGVAPVPDEAAAMALAAAGSVPSEELPAISFSGGESIGATPEIVADKPDADAGLDFERPETLHRNCHYIICNSKEIIGRWDDDGKGWMVHIKDGFVKAQQNVNQLPTMGNYVFIEIEIVTEGPHQRLAGVHAYTLPGAYALTKLAKHENLILEALEQTTTLNDRQRALVRQRVNAKYLPSIWDDAAEF